MKINIKGTNYRVRFLPKNKFNSDEYREHMGYCDYNKKEIQVRNDLKPEDMLETLYHEMIHALLDETGAASIISDDLNEILAESIGKEIVKHSLAFHKAIEEVLKKRKKK